MFETADISDIFFQIHKLLTLPNANSAYFTAKEARKSVLPIISYQIELIQELYVESEENNVSVLHHVILTLHADKAFFLRSVVGTAV